MGYDDSPIFDFLKERNFTGLDGGIFSMGQCHDPDKKHYFLLTDGMLIYSNVPYHTNVSNCQKSFKVEWYLSYADMTKIVNEMARLVDQ